MGLDRHDLVLCAGTARHVPLLERLAPARSAGFAGVSIQPHEVAALEAAGVGAAELQRRVADAGLAIAELDAITTWLPGHEPPRSFPRELARALRECTPERLVPLAASIGARSLNLVEFYGARAPLDAAADAFAAVCDLAAANGLLVHLEFLPWAGIPDLGSAAEIVRRAGRPNGGLMVDSWHLFRGGSTLAELERIPGDRVLGVQLDDAPERPLADLAQETEHRRLLPGEGSFDLVGLVRTLDRIGSRAPVGVEVYSDALASRPIGVVCATSAAATRRVLAAARG